MASGASLEAHSVFDLLSIPTDSGQSCKQVQVLQGVYQRQHEDAYCDRQQDHARYPKQGVCFHCLILFINNGIF